MEKRILLLGAMALLVLQYMSLTKISGLENQVENYQNTVRNEMNSLYNSIGNQTQTINDLLEEQNSFLVSFDYTLGDYDAKTQTLPLSVAITPKEIKVGTTATLHYGKEPLPLQQEGTAFVGTLTLGLLDTFESPKVVFLEGDTQRTEAFAIYINARQEVLPSLYPQLGGSSGYNYKKEIHSVDWNISFAEKAYPADIVFTEQKIQGIVDGNVVWEEPIKGGSKRQPFRKETPLAPGETLEIYAVATDSAGFVHKALMEKHLATKEGEPIPEAMAPPMEEWLYDKDGNLLSSPETAE